MSRCQTTSHRWQQDMRIKAVPIRHRFDHADNKRGTQRAAEIEKMNGNLSRQSAVHSTKNAARTYAGLTLVYRLRLWPSVGPMLCECLEFGWIHAADPSRKKSKERSGQFVKRDENAIGPCPCNCLHDKTSPLSVVCATDKLSTLYFKPMFS